VGDAVPAADDAAVTGGVPATGAAEAVTGLVDRHRASGRPRTLVGLAGEPGAGKSTLAAQLVASLRAAGLTAVVVPMDGFHLADRELGRLGRRDRKGAPDTFDADGYVALLRRLGVPGPRPVWAPDFDRGLEEAVAGSIAVAPDVEVVVTEGNYLLVDAEPWREVRAVLDEAWFVEVDPAERLRRLVARHVRFGRDEEAAVAWATGPDEANARLVRSTRAAADVVVTGPVGPEPVPVDIAVGGAS
jgi:pantothenate kinase